MNIEVTQRVIGVIARIQKIPLSEIDISSKLEELGMDSFDAVSLLFALEEEFDIEIPDVAKEYRHVSEIIVGIESLLSQFQVAES